MRDLSGKPVVIVSIIAAALIAMAPDAWAQGADESEKRVDERAEDTLEALLIVAFKRDLGLETAEAVELASRATTLVESRRDFAKQQSRLRRDLMDAIDSAEPAKEKIDALIAKAFELRGAFVADQQKSFFELSQGLTPVQRGKLFVSLERFEERVRKHLRRSQESGRRGRGRDDDREEDDL